MKYINLVDPFPLFQIPNFQLRVVHTTKFHVSTSLFRTAIA